MHTLVPEMTLLYFLFNRMNHENGEKKVANSEYGQYRSSQGIFKIFLNS